MEISKQNSLLTDKLVKLYDENKSMLHSSTSSLIPFRTDAMQKFQKIGAPSIKSEDYKYTRIDKLLDRNLSIAKPTESCKLNMPAFTSLEAFQLNFCNGNHCGCKGSLDLPAGVLLGSFKQIISEHPALLDKFKSYITDTIDDSLEAFSAAMAQDGFFLFVPEGIEIDIPIQISIGLSGTDNSIANQRNLIVLEKGAKASMLFVEQNIDNCEIVFNQSTAFIVGDEAQLDVNIIQDFMSKSVVIDAQRYILGSCSKVHQTLISLNAGTIRNNLKSELRGEHSSMTINGLSVLNESQHVDNFTSIAHRVPNCLSNQLYKNVLDGNSFGAFSGQIQVFPDAQKTNAFQRNNNVLLSKNAQMHAKPQLIIDADDVKCSHGATIGQIDDDALFYMRARGISEQEASTMLMSAFCSEIIREISNELIRDIVQELVEVKLSSL